MKKYIITPFLLLVLFSCEKDANLDMEIKEVIRNEIVLFSNITSPPELKELYNSSKILLFGETHYVQEHQDFIISQLGALSDAGYRVIFEELFHSFTWMVEDYLNGNIDELPEFILYFNESLIEGVKQFNSTVEDSLKFKIAYMDVNHWPTNFFRSIDEIENIIGEQVVFSSIKYTEPDSEAYRSGLQVLKNQIELDTANYIGLWGKKWFNRVLEIIEIEIASSKFRINRSDEWRESVMFDNINKLVQRPDSKKYLVNTGFFHGQKQTYMGNSIDRICKRLKNVNDNTNSIAFVGIRGNRKQRFNDLNSFAFDLSEESDADDMIKEIDRIAGNNMSFLSLSDISFSNLDIKISYSSGSVITAPIGKQFDAILTYPEISTLTSMDIYDWN